jgi:hypothetical protein
MAEPYRDSDPNAPQNPPNSVVNRDVRKTALRTFLTPLIVFFAIVGVVLIYWATREPRGVDVSDIPHAEGTTGHTAPQAATPGGHEPNPNPSSTREDLEMRGGEPITELHAFFGERVAALDDRRVDIKGVTVERVDSPAIFWVRDGNARVAVVAPEGSAPVKQGQTVNLTGTVQRSGNELRIRASRIDVN